uniref:Uncharacterized protein n=1 Tax=Anopheles farauti TaxID=69004 RepID=A0A182Q3T0_9DIPT
MTKETAYSMQQSSVQQILSYYHNDSVHWHLKYLQYCSQRTSDAQQQFEESVAARGTVCGPRQRSCEYDSDPEDIVKGQLNLSSMNKYSIEILNGENQEQVTELFDRFHQLKLNPSNGPAAAELGPKIILTDFSTDGSGWKKQNGTHYADGLQCADSVEANNNDPEAGAICERGCAGGSDVCEKNAKNNNGDKSNYLQIPGLIYNQNSALKPPAFDCYHSEARPP